MAAKYLCARSGNPCGKLCIGCMLRDSVSGPRGLGDHERSVGCQTRSKFDSQVWVQVQQLLLPDRYRYVRAVYFVVNAPSSATTPTHIENDSPPTII